MLTNIITKIFIIVVILSFASSAANAQMKVYEVRGRVCDPNGNSIAFAHVVNINRSTACISDTAGKFRMVMVKTDTVKISCIGFEITGFSINNFPIDDNEQSVYIGDLVMTPRTYELSTVNIYSERWKSFLYDYQQIEPQEEPEYVEKIEKWKENIVDVTELKLLRKGSVGFGIPLDFGHFKKKRAEKNISRIDKLEEASRRYNPTVISEVTGMSMEESQKFMSRFQLDPNFVISRNDYDLYLIITQLYKEYKIDK